ncbi:MAG: hypothetical protein OXF27_04325 [Acidobacteria bacterium]|nr:hypothetical protein [Acidobacteriota bacterium]
MANRRVISTMVLVAVYALTLAVAVNAQSGQMPTTADGRPDLSGVWQAAGSAHWDIEPHAAYAGRLPDTGAIGAAPGGQGIVEGGTIPYRPEAVAQKQRNFENRRTDDPEAKCFLPGVPRATYMPFPFQIVQGTDKIFIGYEYGSANRVVHLDEVPESPVDTWMGHSLGRWEGDTLVVDVSAFNGQTWFDRAGNFHSSALHVVERYTLITPYHLQYEATIEDPETFTRPWKISLPLYRRMEDGARLLEFKCIPFAEELMYGHLRWGPEEVR